MSAAKIGGVKKAKVEVRELAHGNGAEIMLRGGTKRACPASTLPAMDSCFLVLAVAVMLAENVDRDNGAEGVLRVIPIGGVIARNRQGVRPQLE